MIDRILINFEEMSLKDTKSTNTRKSETENNNTKNEVDQKKDKIGKEYEKFIIDQFEQNIMEDYYLSYEKQIAITNKDIDGNSSLYKEYFDLYTFILKLNDDTRSK